MATAISALAHLAIVSLPPSHAQRGVQRHPLGTYTNVAINSVASVRICSASYSCLRCPSQHRRKHHRTPPPWSSSPSPTPHVPHQISVITAPGAESFYHRHRLIILHRSHLLVGAPERWVTNAVLFFPTSSRSPPSRSNAATFPIALVSLTRVHSRHDMFHFPIYNSNLLISNVVHYA